MAPLKSPQIIIVHESNILNVERAILFSSKIEPYVNSVNFLSIHFLFRGDIFIAVIVMKAI